MKTDGIILDVDGTLWDSTPVVAIAYNQAIEKWPEVSVMATAERLRQLFGKLIPEIADEFFPSLAPAKRYQLIDECIRKEHEILPTADVPPYPGVVETVQKLSRHLPVYIVSNCEAGYIELFMEKTGLKGYISDFTCPDYTGLDKGGNIRLIAERNHLSAPVYVGDTAGDQKACKKAKVPFCYAAYGFGKAEKPEYTIQKFSDLLMFLD